MPKQFVITNAMIEEKRLQDDFMAQYGADYKEAIRGLRSHYKLSKKSKKS